MNIKNYPHWPMDFLAISVDMAGCPNRCRHCWLGASRNGNISVQEFHDIADQFRRWRDINGQGIRELGFLSWWREPDYREDYRELWTLEQELSSPGRAYRFELLSTWRLARDENYAQWAATLPPKACQITFSGMAENTDWFMRRKGGFNDQILATNRCLEVGIAPRWQLFLTKRNLAELDEFVRLIDDLNLIKRCERNGQKFVMFIGGISPEGSGYDLEDARLESDDLGSIPDSLINLSQKGLAMLGHPENALLAELGQEDNPPNMDANIPAVAVNADYDVYPNNAEPTEWWRLGNLKRDGVDAIITAYRDETPPAMHANRTIPIRELARRYGRPDSKYLYSKDDLICRMMHQCGVDYLVGRR